MRTGSAVYYLHSDHLGSASLTTDASGNKVGELRYTPYGETRSGYPTGNVPTDRRYTGQAQEESLGLYFYNARWYDSTLGRFLSADTLVPSPGNPQSLNRYSYGYNNPVKYIDSTGHFPILPLVILAGIGIGIVMHELLAPPAQDISPLSIEPIKTPRAEPPTSPDMTEWLVDQMQTTAKAPVTQAFQEHFSSLSPADQLGALKAWVAMVRTDAVWDFKGDIQAAELPGLPIVTLGGQQLNYQAVANIFFGFEGRATGQAGWFLKAGAGAFQAVYWLPKNSSNVGPVTTSFDDPFDNWSIGFGIFLYDLYGQNLDALTPEAFSTALEQYTEQYGAPPSPLTP
jgi:RHS repeat-associated protein